MKVIELKELLSNYNDDDEIELISSEGVDEEIVGETALDDFGIPSHVADNCFTIALKINNDYYMEDIICHQGDL